MQKKIQNVIFNKTGYRCSYKKASLSFLGKQRITAILLEKNDASIFVEQATVDIGLFNFLLFNEIRSIHIKNWILEKRYNTDRHFENIRHKGITTIPSIRNFESENGIIIIKDLLSSNLIEVNDLNLKKTQTSFFIDALTKENSRNGRIIIKYDTDPEDFELKLVSVPLSLFLMPFSTSYPSYNNLLNVDCTTKKEGNKIYRTCHLQSEDLRSTITGEFKNNTVLVHENDGSFLSIKSRLASQILQNFLPNESTVKSSDIAIDLQKAVLPLTSAKIKILETKGLISIKDLVLVTPNHKLVWKKIRLNFERKYNRITGQGSSEMFPDNVASSLKISFDHQDSKTFFGINQTNLSEKFIEKILLLNSDIALPQVGENYSLTALGKIQNKKISGQVTLKDSMLNLNLETEGSFNEQTFNLTGHYTFPESLIKKYALPISAIQLKTKGVMLLNDKKLSVPEFTGSISSKRGLLTFHSKKPDRLAESYLVSIDANLNSFPIFGLDPKLQSLVIKNSQFTLNCDGEKKTAKGNLRIIFEKIDSTAPEIRLNIPDISLNNIDPFDLYSFKNADFSCEGLFYNLPLDRLVSHFGIPQESFSGHFADASFKTAVTSSKNKMIDVQGKLTSNIIQASGNIRINDSFSVDPSSQISFKWHISPGTYKSFFKNMSYMPSCLLNRTTVMEWDIKKLSCSPDKKDFNCLQSITQGGMEAAFKFSPIVFSDHETRNTLIFNELSGKFESYGDNLPINFLVEGHCVSPDSSGNTGGKIILSGDMAHPLSNKRNLTGNFYGENIYSHFLTGIFPIAPDFKNKLTDLYSGAINFLIKTQITENKGNFDTNFYSPEWEMSAPVLIEKSQITLQKDLKINFNIHNKAVKQILQDTVPIISPEMKSSYPVVLTIKSKDFLIPFNPYNLKDVQIGGGILEPGKLILSHNENIETLLKLIDKKNSEPLISAWFTPIYFDLSGGILSCRRFDALLQDDIHLALWGQTNLNERTLNMTLGIDPFILKKYFKDIPYVQDKLFLVRITGPVSKPDINWKSANLRLNLLQKTPITRYFVGNFLDKVLDSFGEKIPPPTTNPFPWNNKIKK